MRHIFHLVLFLVLGICGLAQDRFSYQIDFGDQGDSDRFKRSLVVEDTLYGVTAQICDSIKCITVVKMDIDGNILKERVFKNIGASNRDMIRQDVDKFVIASRLGVYEDCAFELLVINRDLDSLMHRIIPIGEIVPDIESHGVNAVVAYDDYYVTSGFMNYDRSKNDRDHSAMLSFFDKETLALDTVILTVLDPEHGSEIHRLFVDDNNLLTTAFNEYVLNGLVERGLRKYNNDKEVVWEWRTDTLNQMPRENSLLLSNGNMLIIPEPFGPFINGMASDYRMLCISPSGEEVWQYIEWDDYFKRRNITNIGEGRNGDIFVYGIMDTPFETDLVFPEVPEEQTFHAGFITRISGDGQKLWERVYFKFDEHGKVVSFMVSDVHELSDGSLINTGGIYIFEGIFPVSQDSWVFRTDSVGCIYADCGFVGYTSSTEESETLALGFDVSPNPSTGEIRFELPDHLTYPISLEIRNVSGKVMKRDAFPFPVDSYIQNVEDWGDGIYFIVISGAKGRRSYAAFLKKS